MKYSNIPAAQLLVFSCKAAGIKDIVISPGSRNAPLTVSFTADPFFNCFSIVDERCAAFFALGIAQNQRRPTAIVCTSGSALLNYYPAIAEAFYSDIPLVVISADRPTYKIDVGDGQTIRQDNVFDRHIGYSANLKMDVSHARERVSVYFPEHLENTQGSIDDYNKKQINSAFAVAFGQKLPIHINIPFEEPLYGVREVKDKDTVHMAIEPSTEIDLDFDKIKKIWNGSKRKMVLVGVNSPGSIDAHWLGELSKDPSILVFTETTSNLHHPSFFPSIDSIIFPIEKSKNTDERFTDLRPEVLLTLGGLVVSKKVKAFLRKYRPKYHWHVHETKAYDTYFSLTGHFKVDANDFLSKLLSNNEVFGSPYFKTWGLVKKAYESKRNVYAANAPFSDFSVFHLVQEQLPAHAQVHLSNSSTVRYAQLFPINPSIKVYCNRGTSGIDGCTSTAIGSALYHTEPTILITGDLSFFYDSNALWNDYLRSDFRIILINNSGGGIFRILPGFDGSEKFATFFETKHRLTAKQQCEQFDLDYSSATNMMELKNALSSFFQDSEKPKLLEIFTPREVNDKILLGYFDFISSDYS
ncbi:2-succinyl-5-enolpyruvyl-6-hydroxy-3-cyclohexene-1-carboxylic-acid synthase [Flavobacteriaceae bacterium GF1]